MDFLYFHFPVSGVETYLFLPPLVMFLISVFVSMGGVTGAFVLLPFQMSVLGYTGPGVSATNFVYNIIAIPLGVSRYIRRGEMCWLLFWVFVLGSLPGLLIGYYIRVTLLPDPTHFRPFVGIVLGLLAIRTLKGAWQKENLLVDLSRKSGKITTRQFGWTLSQVSLNQKVYSIPTLLLVGLSLAVGLVGGIYGIGGGAFLAPFCISALNLPPLIVAGAALFSTWIISIVGALMYDLIPAPTNLSTSPDWLLGCLFGIGGMVGVYVGTRLQKIAPLSVIRIGLGVALAFISFRYIWAYFD